MLPPEPGAAPAAGAGGGGGGGGEPVKAVAAGYWVKHNASQMGQPNTTATGRAPAEGAVCCAL